MFLSDILLAALNYPKENENVANLMVGLQLVALLLQLMDFTA